MSQNALTGDGQQHGILDKNTANGMSAEVVAKAILEGVARKSRDIVLASPVHKLAIYLNLLVPSLMDHLLRIRQKLQ